MSEYFDRPIHTKEGTNDDISENTRGILFPNFDKHGNLVVIPDTFVNDENTSTVQE